MANKPKPEAKKRPRKPRPEYVPPVEIERVHAMLRAIHQHLGGKKTIGREMYLEIFQALFVFWQFMLDQKFAKPSRAAREDLVKARVVCDLLEEWPVPAMTPKIKQWEAVQAVFESADPDNAVRNFQNLRRSLATAYPVVGSNVPLIWAAYERIVKAREAEKKKAKRK